MMRTTMRTLALAALAVALVGLTADMALAGPRGGGGGGFRGGSGFRGGYGGYGSYGGYRGGWGYGGGIYLGLGSPYYGSYYGGYGTPSYGYSGDYYPADIYPDTVPSYQSNYYTPSSAVAPLGYNTTRTDLTATLNVHVPQDAKVWVDDDATQQSGEFRMFSSPPLTADKEFHYTIRAQWNDNGQVVNQTRRVPVRAGQTTTIDFLRPAPADESPK